MSANQHREGDLVTTLEEADTRVEEADDSVEQFGQAKLEELAAAYNEFTGLLDRYEDQVVGDAGDYETNIEFQSQIADFLQGIEEEMLLYETFAECDEYLQQRWFNESDFEHVREQLEPVADLVGRIEEYEAALAEYRETRREMTHRIRELDDRISELERLSRLGTADLDAPTERLQEPIRAYNEAVTDAFETFLAESTARTVISFLERMEDYPLVEFEAPPEQLRDYLQDEAPGEETIGTLVEYADYSRSKLDHYVDDPDRLKHVIGGKQTFLSGLDADPLRIDWPPPSATELPWRCRALRAAVNRFAPAVVEQLRAVEALPRETEYERLRDSALASEELTDAERERIRAREVESELQAARDERQRLQAALEAHPER